MSRPPVKIMVDVEVLKRLLGGVLDPAEVADLSAAIERAERAR